MKRATATIERKCHACGGRMRAARENYHYTQCGLNSVSLKNIVVFHCECGAVVPEIPAMADLHREIMIAVLRKKSLLSGEEIRFLRKMAGLSAVELARLLGAHPVTISKWENETRNIGVSNDRVLRLICFAGMLQQILRLKNENMVGKMAARAREITTLDIRSLLEKIEETSDGPATVVIDPAVLSGLGTAEEEAVLPARSTIQ